VNGIENTKSRLMTLCKEYEVFGDALPNHYVSADLIEHGLIDSMTTVYLQEILHEHFSLEISPELFMLELRTMDALAKYVHTEMPA